MATNSFIVVETGSDPGFLGFLSAAAGRHLEQQKKKHHY